jgi:hypothetical protein
MREAIEMEHDPTNPQAGCLLALAVCFLFWGAVLAVALLGGWL